MYEVTQATAVTFRLFTVNLLKVLLVLVLLEYSHPPSIFFGHQLSFKQQQQQQQQQSRQHQVSAARIKGLIYNKDGKFIYRPSRSNQAHIIVIDDRSPKTQASSKYQDNSNSSSPSLTSKLNEQQRSSSSSFVHDAPMLQVFNAQQLYHPAAAAAAVAQLASANSIRAIYAPGGGAPPFTLINLSDLPTSTAGAQLSAAANFAREVQGGGGGGGGRLGVVGNPLLQAHAVLPTGTASIQHQHMLQQPIQFVPSRASQIAMGQQQSPHQQAQQHHHQQAAAPPTVVDTYVGYGSPLMQPTPSFISSEFPAAADIEQYQAQSGRAQASSGGYDGINQAQASYYPMPVMSGAHRQRGAVTSYEQSHAPLYGNGDVGGGGSGGGGGGVSGGSGGQIYDSQQPPDFVPFDELPSSSSGPQTPLAYSGNSLRNQVTNSYIGPTAPMSHHQTMKSRRAIPASGGPIQDLDDAEGDHIDYYDAELRERGRGSAGSYERGGGGYGGGHRQYVRAPFSLADGGNGGGGGSQSGAGQSGRGGGRDHNDLEHRNEVGSQQMAENQTPIPGSIQSIKYQLKRSNQSSSGGGGGGSSSVAKMKSKHSGGDHSPKAIITAPNSDNNNSSPISDQRGGGGGGVGGGGNGKEPKSMQYWRQYQDQFDIVK